MIAIANLQYAWTFFANPLVKHYGVTLAVVQIAFSTFVLAETWLVPFEGFLIDKIGPRLIIGAGGVLVGLSWIGSGWLSPTISHLIFWYTVGGIGAGAVSRGTVGNALQLLPDPRGVAVGLTAGSYGIGTALTVAPIATMIKSSGYANTFGVRGIIQGTLVLV